MDVGAGLYMYDVVVKSSRSLSHLLMSFARPFVKRFELCYRSVVLSILSVCLSRGLGDVYKRQLQHHTCRGQRLRPLNDFLMCTKHLCYLPTHETEF